MLERKPVFIVTYVSFGQKNSRAEPLPSTDLGGKGDSLNLGHPGSASGLIILTFLTGIVHLTNQCLQSIWVMKKAAEIMMIIICLLLTHGMSKEKKNPPMFLCYRDSYG